MTKELMRGFMGLAASLKQAFGTDVELRIKHGGMDEQVAHAQGEVGRMSRAAAGLMEGLNGAVVDSVETEMELIIKHVK